MAGVERVSWKGRSRLDYTVPPNSALTREKASSRATERWASASIMRHRSMSRKQALFMANDQLGRAHCAASDAWTQDEILEAIARSSAMLLLSRGAVARSRPSSSCFDDPIGHNGGWANEYPKHSPIPFGSSSGAP